ncbi:MAG: hypothetical protein RL095_3317 [Verrucomicrobiota bacterium]|jgi:exodeoxyribonuclease VII large subunit
MAEAEIISVSAAAAILRDRIENALPPFWISGEISQAKVYPSGHVYFTLKDSGAALSCVWFSGASSWREGALREGQEIEALARPGFHSERGQLQLVIRLARPCGQGSLQAAFEALKERLRREGLFDTERKKQLPLLPRRIGVITSPEGAALRDFLQVLGRRFPFVRVRIYPTLVQGREAAANAARALRWAASRGEDEILVLTRGGGSLEDLWPFNDEDLVRSVAACPVPTVSAIGHEVDFSLCDFAADLRAPTPSAAAEMILRPYGEWLEHIGQLRRRLEAALEASMKTPQRRLAQLEQRLQRASPQLRLRDRMQKVDQLVSRLDQAMSLLLRRRSEGLAPGAARLDTALQRLLERRRSRLAELAGRLEAMSPQRVLERGYALARFEGQVLTRARQVQPGDEVELRLAQGSLRVQVLKIDPPPPE